MEQVLSVLFLQIVITRSCLFEYTPRMVKTLNYSPYYKGPVCMPTHPIRYPVSVSEVVAIVNEAIRFNTTCKAFGSLHSASDIVCTDGIPISMSKLNKMWMNSDKSVTVEAGANLYEVAEFLKFHGRGLKTTPAFGNITIGGAIGTGAHGSSLRYTSSISEQVLRVTVVDGLGMLREIQAEEDMLAFRVHLGLLGIIVRVTLRTSPLYKVLAHNYVVSDIHLFDGSYIDMVKNTDQISIYWFPSFHSMIISNWTIIDVRTEGNAWTNDHVPSFSKTLNMITHYVLETGQQANNAQILNLAQSLTKSNLLSDTPFFPPIYTEDGYNTKNPAVGYYHRMFAPICQDHGDSQCPWFNGPYNISFLDNEVSIDMEYVSDFSLILKDIVSKYPAVFPQYGILLRFSSGTSTYMSTANGKDTCHFEYYIPRRVDPYNTASAGLAAYQTLQQTLIFKYNGKSHWGKSGSIYKSKNILQRNLHPRNLALFLKKVEEYDPNGVFMNDFGRRLKGISDEINIDPETKHCALLDNCFCLKDTDCAPGQKCSHIEGYPHYPACITPKNFLDFFIPNPNNILTYF